VRPVRISAKAIVVQDGRLLVTRHRDGEGDWYLLPGGGQEPGESLPEAVQRECREEAGVDVAVHRLLFVRDYISRNHEFAAQDGEAHQVELMFACTLLPGQVPRNGPLPDGSQIGVGWLEVADLDRYRLYPQTLKPLLAGLGDRPAATDPYPVYLGDVN
jgi:8-oxo-dGTP diphosphatase